MMHMTCRKSYKKKQKKKTANYARGKSSIAIFYST
jgi:hypothetical protein